MFGVLIGILLFPITFGDVDVKKFLKELSLHNNPMYKPYGVNTVNVFGDFRRLVEINEKNGLFTIQMTLYLHYNMPQIRWEPNVTYGDHDMFVIPYLSVWFSDITAFNMIEMKYVPPRLATVSFNGDIFTSFPVTATIPYKTDMRTFPYDHQPLNVELGSWNYPESILTFVWNSSIFKQTMPKGSVNSHEQWNIKIPPTSKTTQRLLNNGERTMSFSLIILSTTVHRKPMFYEAVLIYPSGFITILAFLNVLISPESGEKINHALTTFLAEIIFLLFLVEVIPASSDPLPILIKIIMVKLFVETLNILKVITVCNLFERQAKFSTLPRWCKRVLTLRFIKALFFLPDINKALPKNIDISIHEWETFAIFVDRMGGVLLFALLIALISLQIW